MKENNKNIFKGYRISFETGRAYYLLWAYLVGYQYVSDKNKWYPKIDGTLGDLNSHFMRWYYLIKNDSLFEKELVSSLSNPNLLLEMEKDITDYTDETVKLLENTNWEKMSDSQLKDAFLFYCQQFVKIVCSAGYIRKIDRSVIKRFNDYFGSISHSDDRIACLSMNTRPTASFQEEIELLKFAERILERNQSLDSPEISKNSEEIHKKYCFLSCGYYTEKAKSIDDYKVRLKEIINNNPSKLLKEIVEHAEEEGRKRDNILNTLGTEEKKLASITSESTYIKDLYKFLIEKIIYYAEDMFTEIGKRTNKSTTLLKDLLPKEIAGLLDKKSLNDKKIRERAEHSIIIITGKKIEIMGGKKADKFEDKYLEIKEEKNTDFKGRIACKGYGKGIAKIILRPADFEKFNKGDILVTGSTNPDFVPIMKKASAIVAEEGGLTAHVSVISREFRIPCIVGIPNIVKAIKDGDLVEVDANNGIVRIIK